MSRSLQEALTNRFSALPVLQVVLDCCEGVSQREAMDSLLRKVDEEKTLKAESLVKLLGAVKASFPGLPLVLDSLMTTANVSGGKGMGALNFRAWGLSSGNCWEVWMLVWMHPYNLTFM